MSGKTDDIQKSDKSKTDELASAFMKIMKMRENKKKPDDNAKEQYRIAKEALEPFIVHKVPKSIGELGWLAGDYQKFVEQMELAKKARGGKLSRTDWPGAAEHTRKAVEIAKDAQDKKILKDKIALDIGETTKIIGPLDQYSKPTYEELNKKLSLQFDALQKATSLGNLEEVASAVKSLKVEARQKLAELAPKSSELQKKRAELQLRLNLQINELDNKLGALAFKTLEQGKITFIEAEIRSLTEPDYQKQRNTLLEKADNSDLKTDEKRIEDLTDRFELAQTEVTKIGAAMEKRIKEQAPALLRLLVDGQAEFRKGLDLQAAAKKFEEDFAVVEKGLAELRDLGTPYAQVLTDNAAKDKETMLKDKAFTRAPMVIKVFLDQIEVAKKNAVSSASVEGEKLEAELVKFRKEVRNEYAKDDRIKPAYRKLLTEIDQLDVIVETNNTGAFASARQRMEAIKAAGLGGTIAIITQLLVNADAIAVVTGNATVAQEFESDTNEILLAVKTAFKDLDLYDVAKGAKTFADLKAQADDLKQKTDALLKWREGITQKLKALDGMIKEFRKLVPGSKPTTFELNAKDAKEKYDKPGVDRAAVDKLISDAERVVYPMINNIREVGPGQNKVIEALEKDFSKAAKIIEDEEQKKTDKANKHKDIETRINTFKGDLVKAREAVDKDPTGDQDELSELKILFKQVQKKFDAKDDDGAGSQLAGIEVRLKKLLEVPGGVTAGSVKELLGVATQWDNAMKAMRLALDMINDGAKVVAPVAKVDPKEIETPLNRAYARFEPFKKTLVQSVLQLAEGEKAKVSKDEHAKLLKARKAARESALVDVRSLYTILDTDPVVVSLANNPFVKGSPFSEMRKFAQSIEYNALRAVPPE